MQRHWRRGVGYLRLVSERIDSLRRRPCLDWEISRELACHEILIVH